MKKYIILAFIIGLSGFAFAQQSLSTQYPEELYQYGGNGAMGGTARFQGMSGAMGALGGDLSAMSMNPAGASVFLKSEAAFTLGVNMSKIDLNNNSGSDFSDSKFNFNQAGGVLIFDQLNSNTWKNVALGVNYQQQNIVNEAIALKPNRTGQYNNIMTDHYSERYGVSSMTNVTVAANYNDQFYFGGGINFHTFEADNLEFARIDEAEFGENFRYLKDYSPNSRLGTGASVSLGVIARVHQQLRLGASYQSPTWYKDTEELVTQYGMYSAVDDLGDYYYIDRDVLAYLNDMTSSHKFTGSAAFVIGNYGLISADYTYTDYSAAKFKPTDSFMGENDFIDNAMKGTSTFRVGGEMRLQDLSLRAGYRYEQTPFEETYFVDVDDSYQPFGDLTGFSVGAGYNFNDFYIDAAYSFFKRDRNYLIAGNYYDYGGSIGADGLTEGEALDYLSFNAGDSGFAQSIKDITEKQGNIVLSVGFRF